MSKPVPPSYDDAMAGGTPNFAMPIPGTTQPYYPTAMPEGPGSQFVNQNYEQAPAGWAVGPPPPPPYSPYGPSVMAAQPLSVPVTVQQPDGTTVTVQPGTRLIISNRGRTRVPLVSVTLLRRQPVLITCPNCQSHVMTNVHVGTNCTAHVCCGLMFLFGCWCCCFIPYCMEGFREYNHTCSNCNAYLGSFSPS